MPPSASDSGRLVLGSSLRPIVFGGSAGSPNLFAAFGAAKPPELILSVHAPDRSLLGYYVLDRSVQNATWGGLSISADGSLAQAIASARATAAQIELFGLARGAHHALLLADGASTARAASLRLRLYLDALHPLARHGICRIAYTSRDGRLSPPLAAAGRATSAIASSVGALEAIGADVGLATIAVHGPPPIADAIRRAAAERGLRVVETAARGLGTRADIVLLADPAAPLTIETADALEARAVTVLEPASAPPAATRRLRERGVVLVPQELAAAGPMLVLDYRARGLDARSAVSRTHAAVRSRTVEAFGQPVSVAAAAQL